MAGRTGPLGTFEIWTLRKGSRRAICTLRSDLHESAAAGAESDEHDAAGQNGLVGLPSGLCALNVVKPLPPAADTA